MTGRQCQTVLTYLSVCFLPLSVTDGWGNSRSGLRLADTDQVFLFVGFNVPMQEGEVQCSEARSFLCNCIITRFSVQRDCREHVRHISADTGLMQMSCGVSTSMFDQPARAKCCSMLQQCCSWMQIKRERKQTCVIWQLFTMYGLMPCMFHKAAIGQWSDGRCCCCLYSVSGPPWTDNKHPSPLVRPGQQRFLTPSLPRHAQACPAAPLSSHAGIL